MMKIIDDHECLTFTRQLLADLPLAMTNNKTIIPKVLSLQNELHLLQRRWRVA